MKLVSGIRHAIFALALVTLTSANADWPERAIHIVVPFAPGGPTDQLARALVPEMAAALGQPVVIDNRSGAGGNIGAAVVARAAPDGYTLLMGTVGTQSVNQWLQPRPPFDPQKDFVPISLLAEVPNVMVVPAAKARDAGIQSAADFVRYAKARPGRLNMASSGTGTGTHLSGELFKARAGVYMVHIPFAGSTPALMNLAAGEMDVMFDTLPSAMPLIASGKLKALAVTGSRPSAVLPGVPTVEQAAGLHGFQSSSWSGLLAPAGTPAVTVERLHGAALRAMHSPAVLEQLRAAGATGLNSSPQEFASFIEAESRKWLQVLRASGAKID